MIMSHVISNSMQNKLLIEDKDLRFTEKSPTRLYVDCC